MSQIVTAPSEILSKAAKPIVKIDNNIKKVIEEMKEALLSAKDPIGVGLAAPQIGYSLRIFITKPENDSPINIFINPEMEIIQKKIKPVKKKVLKKGEKLEGCLSLPNIWGNVTRNNRLKLKYLDENGNRMNKIFTGLMAIIIQHEMDHLNGILFPKRVLEQNQKLYKSEKNEKGEDIFSEIEI